MDWINLLSFIFGGAGLVSFIIGVVTIREAKKLKGAEVDTAKINNLASVVDQLKKQVEFQSGQIDKLHKELGEAREAFMDLNSTYLTLDTKYNLKKLCISQAYGCSREDCPVLAKQKEQEENWIKQQNKG